MMVGAVSIPGCSPRLPRSR